MRRDVRKLGPELDPRSFEPATLVRFTKALAMVRSIAPKEVSSSLCLRLGRSMGVHVHLIFNALWPLT